MDDSKSNKYTHKYITKPNIATSLIPPPLFVTKYLMLNGDPSQSVAQMPEYFYINGVN
jgi:hypothetical protein